MSRTYSVIDSDGHVLEPPDLWSHYIDPSYLDRAPTFTIEPDGTEHLRVGDAVWSLQQGFGGTGSYGSPRTGIGDNLTYACESLNSAEQVKQIVEVSNSMGRDIATPGEAREIMHIQSSKTAVSG